MTDSERIAELVADNKTLEEDRLKATVRAEAAEAKLAEAVRLLTDTFSTLKNYSMAAPRLDRENIGKFLASFSDSAQLG